MATDSEILGWIDTAIEDVLTNGQSVSDEGTTYTKSDLRMLERMRERYEKKVGAASGSIFDRTLTGTPYRG